ncbi:GtrA family protein [Pedobacter sp. JY14-1]|uniref:GtrA family protein n=1 Tax=Pedobacter sp. JY14-1 TaxID=3034151 RepID=UPI0023E1D7F1|nr:GtrA family protein [Pedobacter sp. JY14-1]
MGKAQAIYTFAKAQFSAFAGGIIDYLVMLGCTELLHIHYTISIGIGGVIGAVFNFTVNRYWTFSNTNASKNPVGGQLIRFVFVVCGSIILKSSGTWLFTTYLHIDYKISRIIVDLIVSLGFNYVLQNYWVFKRKPPTDLPAV